MFFVLKIQYIVLKTTCNSYKKQVIKHKLYIKTIFMFVFRASQKNNKKSGLHNFICGLTMI